MDKRALHEALRAQLAAELERATRHALDAAEATTHEENRAESDKDMRSTEASYVARGQALRARDLALALKRLDQMALRDFGAGDRIEASALVVLEDDGRRATYFIVPAGGGQRIGAVHTLATTSPLGAALLGLTAGDEVEVGARCLTVVAVR
jgi:transcription elongation GreA/GreB family factor